MGKRRKARECALQLLFQLEFNPSDPEDLISQYWKGQKAGQDIRDYGTWIVEGIRSSQEDVDRVIQTASVNWRISRMAVVDRNILRIAVYELLNEKSLAPAIIINEAIEIAKRYSGEEAPVFINGILDAVRKTLRAGEPSSDEDTKEGRHGQRQRKSKNGKRAAGTGNEG